PGVTNSGALIYLFILLCLLEKIRVSLLQTYPFRLPLEKAEIATRSGSPLVVFRNPKASFFQYSINVSFNDTCLLKWINGLNVRLRGNISISVLVCSDPYIADHLVFANVFLKRLNFEHLGTPAHSP